MLDIGRVCVKTSGREAGKKCIVVASIDNKFVLIDGGVKRRKCNIAHLEPLDKVIKIKGKESKEQVLEACEKAGIVLETKKKRVKKEKKEKKTKTHAK